MPTYANCFDKVPLGFGGFRLSRVPFSSSNMGPLLTEILLKRMLSRGMISLAVLLSFSTTSRRWPKVLLMEASAAPKYRYLVALSFFVEGLFRGGFFERGGKASHTQKSRERP